jgi:hypothetical protein
MGPLHWEKIETINQAIANEYEVQRKMLIKHLDVTVQSFGCSDTTKSQTKVSQGLPAEAFSLIS